jgi:hypothetical protein
VVQGIQLLIVTTFLFLFNSCASQGHDAIIKSQTPFTDLSLEYFSPTYLKQNPNQIYDIKEPQPGGILLIRYHRNDIPGRQSEWFEVKISENYYQWLIDPIKPDSLQAFNDRDLVWIIPLEDEVKMPLIIEVHNTIYQKITIFELTPSHLIQPHILKKPKGGGLSRRGWVGLGF